MKGEEAHNTAPQRGLRIGGAARVTGLTTSTIRAWEQRYSAIAPHRTPAGYRLYDPETIDRLQLLQALRLRGEPLPNLAPCTTDELRARLGESSSTAAASPSASNGRVRVAVIHPTLPSTLANFPDARVPFEVVLSAASVSTEGPALPKDTDLVIAKLEVLGEDPMTTLAHLAPAGAGVHVLVETGFTKRATVDTLKRRGYVTRQGPLTLTDVTEQALSVKRQRRVVAPQAAQSVTTPPTRFTQKQLSALRELPSNVQCECPRHLATLVLQLAEFERYSMNCQDESPEDAALHAYLTQESGRARELVEEMLTRVCEAEGMMPAE